MSLNPIKDVEIRDGKIIIGVDGSPDINDTFLKNFSDFLKSRSEYQELREVLKIIAELSPAYQNEIREVWGRMVKSSFSRYMDDLVKNDIIRCVGPHERSVRKKIKALALRGDPKFYVFDEGRYVKGIPIREMIQGVYSERLLTSIEERKAFNEKKRLENEIGAMRVEDQFNFKLKQDILPEVGDRLLSEEQLWQIYYKFFGSNPQKWKKKLYLNHLFSKGTLVRCGGNMFQLSDGAGHIDQDLQTEFNLITKAKPISSKCPENGTNRIVPE